jgi:hypothetical protein
MTPSSAFSWLTLAILIGMLLASFAMFTLLERRWTTQRRWVALREWARVRMMKVSRSASTPAALSMLLPAQPWVRLKIGDEQVTYLQLETLQPQTHGWHLLIARCGPWRGSPAALRPVKVATSLVDLLNLPRIPTTVGHERFTLFSDQTRSGRALLVSHARSLIPPDIGLLRVDHWFVLDFSSRPFDPIELDRMLALAKQLVNVV